MKRFGRYLPRIHKLLGKGAELEAADQVRDLGKRSSSLGSAAQMGFCLNCGIISFVANPISQEIDSLLNRHLSEMKA